MKLMSLKNKNNSNTGSSYLRCGVVARGWVLNFAFIGCLVLLLSFTLVLSYPNLVNATRGTKEEINAVQKNKKSPNSSKKNNKDSGNKGQGNKNGSTNTNKGGGGEYTEEQYCKDQKALNKEPIICKSQTEQEKAKITDPIGYDSAKKDYQRAKEAYEKGNQGGNNQNQKDQNNKSQEPEHKDDGDGSNKKKDGNKSGGGNGSTGGGGASSSPHQCGSAGTFFDWGCSGADDSKIIVTTLITISNWIALGAVVIVTFGIIYGAIIYATSAGDATKAKKGISIIRNAIIALMLYLLMWAILQYVVPGGLFG